jgi:hypothetical protein
LSMRNPHPPQRDMVTGPEGVDIETLADPDHAHTLPSGKPMEKTQTALRKHPVNATHRSRAPARSGPIRGRGRS